MFMYHIALSLCLLSLAAGCGLFLMAHRTECCRGLTKFFAVLIIIISVLSTACTLYTGFLFWKNGSFQEMMKMHEMRMQERPSHVPGPIVHPEEHKPVR